MQAQLQDENKMLQTASKMHEKWLYVAIFLLVFLLLCMFLVMQKLSSMHEQQAKQLATSQGCGIMLPPYLCILGCILGLFMI